MDLVIPPRVEHYIYSAVRSCLGSYREDMIEQKIKCDADSIERYQSEYNVSCKREFEIGITELQREFHKIVKQDRRTDEIYGETQSADCNIITYCDYYVGQYRHEKPDQTVLDIGRDILLAPYCSNKTENHHYREE